MKILYCDCFSGISGDMFLSALIDAGYPLQNLRETYDLLKIPEYRDTTFQKVMKGPIQAGQIHLDFSPESHHHRHYADIRSFLIESELPRSVKEKSLAIFGKIAEAEASVHGIPVEEVHFHEVGAVDSILDIVGAAAALDFLEINKVFSSPLPFGSGQINTQHGLLPNPAPATAWLIRDMKAAIYPSDIRAELVTPTGAAILAAFASFSKPVMTVTALGTGAGVKEFDQPNVLRVFIGEYSEKKDKYSEIETNLDDMTPELLGSVMNRLFEAGALDVTFTPIQMKKNRPGIKLSVIAKAEDEEALSRMILIQTTTLGVRVTSIRRYEADRNEIIVETEFGPVKVKSKLLDSKVISVHPEYEECERISRELNLPVLEVANRIQKSIDNSAGKRIQ
ncbi:MAG: nickel pincer cofactor biosynthesis protein LarC [Flexilinea sp.]